MYFINSTYESDERYDFAKFMSNTYNIYDPLTSKFLVEIIALKSVGSYLVIDEEYRPDKLSHVIYGDDMYWWILLDYNNLIAVEDLVAGLTIKYPSVGDIEAVYFSLKSLELAVA